jgi:hypothetical protein
MRSFYHGKKLDGSGDLIGSKEGKKKKKTQKTQTRKTPEPPLARDSPLPQSFLPSDVWHCVYKKISVPAQPLLSTLSHSPKSPPHHTMADLPVYDGAIGIDLGMTIINRSSVCLIY